MFQTTNQIIIIIIIIIIIPKMMVYSGESHLNGWFGGTPISGNHYIEVSQKKKMGYPQLSSISNDVIFPYKLSSDKGVPTSMETPMCGMQVTFKIH